MQPAKGRTSESLARPLVGDEPAHLKTGDTMKRTVLVIAFSAAAVLGGLSLTPSQAAAAEANLSTSQSTVTYAKLLTRS